MRGIQDTAASFFVLLTSSFLHVLLLIPHLLREIRGMNLPNLPEVSCLGGLLVHGGNHHTCIAVIEAPVTIIVVAGWVSLWYSWRPQNALVAFVGKAALWLQGWLPRPSSSRVRGLSCERFGASQWWPWFCSLQLVMALMVPIMIGNVVVTCCCLLRLHLALMLTLRFQLRF